MFAILDIKPRDTLLSFGEVNALVHPDDIRLYELAAQLADATTTLVDHAFRMRHANGNWVWLRARCEFGPAGRRRRTASDRDRRRHHRAEDIGRAHGRGGFAPA